MIELTQDVVDHGASVAAGGERLFGETGSLWAPTVLINVPLEAKVFNEEPFGRRACGG
jgi:succinate-semialdehyde dehydrogenase/glutarate-semialdehyde dehydrogenase